jgi:acetyltransferase-like isoleucine patch superfamily enzyme
MLRYINKVFKFCFQTLAFFLSKVCTWVKFKLNGVIFHSDFDARGIPVINVNLKGRFEIGKRFQFHSGQRFNIIGRQQPCFFIVGKNASLTIGDSVGISCTAIICHDRISIGNSVLIGGGVVIYDTDFHSLIRSERMMNDIKEMVKTSPVTIADGVFIGAHSIILKGVSIGENSIIGAGSVVTRSVPSNQIWGGNPAKFIRSIDSV